MKNLDYREYYRRNLPHYQPRGATFLVKFRLAGSLPTEVLERLKAEAENPIKRNSAKQANQVLGRTGTFWQHENYDHFIRNEAEFERIIKYVLSNPVKAGLVDDWTQWKWSYCEYDM